MDPTALQLAEEGLRATEEQLATAQALVHLGS